MVDPYFGRDFDAHKWLGPPVLLLLLVMGGVGGYALGRTPGAVMGFLAMLALGAWMTYHELQMRRWERDGPS